jgi:hypothetical protein
MKDAEDEAFDDLARRQGAWGGGYRAKRAAAADKLKVEDDDDIQDYRREWVGLTDDEIHALPEYAEDGVIYRLIRAAEAALRSKNNE